MDNNEIIRRLREIVGGKTWGHDKTAAQAWNELEGAIEKLIADLEPEKEKLIETTAMCSVCGMEVLWEGPGPVYCVECQPQAEAAAIAYHAVTGDVPQAEAGEGGGRRSGHGLRATKMSDVEPFDPTECALAEAMELVNKYKRRVDDLEPALRTAQRVASQNWDEVLGLRARVDAAVEVIRLHRQIEKARNCQCLGCNMFRALTKETSDDPSDRAVSE